ncbi:MAG: hypothetical protein GC186_06535 [Rhodobacteraceae bacterium]|nr:hypothetical protein [Paracoccaceae bacterium]
MSKPTRPRYRTTNWSSYTASLRKRGRTGDRASAQPLPHKPRKQRKNPAAAEWGERFREGKWRRERDCGRTFSEPGRLGRTHWRTCNYLTCISFSLTPSFPCAHVGARERSRKCVKLV